MRDVTRRGEMLLVHDLTVPVDEAQDALSAIRSGAVDALMVSGDGETPRVFLLEGADEAHRVLLETLNEGAMIVSSDATVLHANQRLSELLGQEVVGSNLARFLSPEDAAALPQFLTSEGGRGKKEMVLLSPSGAEVPVMISFRKVGGEAVVYTVVVTDLSALKTAQSALQRANEDLEARVLARTADVERMNAALRTENTKRKRLTEELQRKAEELEVADQRKDEFLSMLAHELRNPLSPILTATEMLRAIGTEAPAVERYRAVIERQARNLTRLVDDLLEVSRLTRRTITLKTQTAELGMLVQSAVEAARPLIDACGHTLAVHLPTERVPLQVDPTRFEQVLVNLLNNAAKYTERGGHIDLTVEVVGEEVVLRVKDTGVGIPADLLPHVFDLFVQGKRSLARSQGGLGIGLTLVKSLVQMHGGRVDAKSDGPGKGSEISVTFPLVAQAAGAPAAPRDKGLDGVDLESSDPGHWRADPRLQGDRVTPLEPTFREGVPLPHVPVVRVTGGEHRVLLVEDNADAAEALVDLLEFWGFVVRSADDGEKALAVFQEFRPRAVLIDIGLPGMDGYELGRRLRRLEPRKGAVTLIGLTGYGQERDRSLGMEAGFTHYLVKPVRPDTLWGILKPKDL